MLVRVQEMVAVAPWSMFEAEILLTSRRGDDTWQENYGVWDFSPRKFRDPKGMCDSLHRMGFKVLAGGRFG